MFTAWLCVAELTGDGASEVTATPDPWVTPLVGVAGVLVGAAVTGWINLHAARAARRAESQREALYELQEAAHDLRKALRLYGDEAPRPSDETTDLYDDANGRFELLVERVACEQVRTFAKDWVKLAELYWQGESGTTVTQETAAWLRLQRNVGVELRRIDS